MSVYLPNNAIKEIMLLSNAEDIKSLISSYIQEENNDTDKDYLYVRILSANEYTKYLLNDTLDGSISKQGEDVWHLSLGNVGQSFLIECLGDRGQGYGDYLYHYPNVIRIHRTTSSTRNTTNVNINYELVENNASNNCNMKSIKRVFDITIWWFGNWQSRGSTQSTTLGEVQSLSKNNISISKTLPAVTVSENGGWSETLNIIMYSGFRPIFQYIDNKKSENFYC